MARNIQGTRKIENQSKVMGNPQPTHQDRKGSRDLKKGKPRQHHNWPRERPSFKMWNSTPGDHDWHRRAALVGTSGGNSDIEKLGVPGCFCTDAHLVALQDYLRNSRVFPPGPPGPLIRPVAPCGRPVDVGPGLVVPVLYKKNITKVKIDTHNLHKPSYSCRRKLALARAGEAVLLDSTVGLRP